MRGGCDQVSVFEGRGNRSSCHQTADVSHVSHQVGIDVGAELQERREDGSRAVLITAQASKPYTYINNAL